jgi:Domain of unknown function (DUF6983)
MPFVIPVADLNSQAVEATLDDTLFYIILNWNQSGGYWTLGINNAGYQTVVDRICLSPNFPLTRQFKYSDMPAGDLVAQSFYFRSGPIPRDGFSSGKYELVYYTEQDIRIANALR